MKTMKKRYIIVIVCLIILSSGLALFLNYANQPKTIENQISDELGVEEDSIKFFDEQEYGQYRIVGFEYTTEQYGIARINLSEDLKVEEIITTDKMLRRAERVWNCPMSVDGENIYTFLSANEELDSILWIENDDKRSFTVDHYPAVINVVHDPGDAEYYLLDKNGKELQ